MAKILIVEDDADLVETYTDFLEVCGHTVRTASRISEAKNSILALQPELITLDLSLPDNSSAVISQFICNTKSFCQCKIIVISGHAEMISGQEWADQVDLVLTKPVDNHQLSRMISRLLSARTG